MLMLLCAVATFAQLEVGKVYQLKSGRDASKVMYNKSDKPGTAAMSNSDYSQLFTIESGTIEGTYAVRDLNFNKYLKPNTNMSGVWTNASEKSASTDLYISVEDEETGAVSIRFSEPSVAGTYNGAHHEGWYGDIVSWEATADASKWTPVEIGTIDELNAKIEQEKATYNSAKSNAAEILASANYSLVSTTEIALQVEDPNAAGYVWANTYAPGEEGVIDYLIDGDNNTFFHTTWENGSYATDGTKDYLEVDLGEGESATNIVFDFVTRHNASTDFPSSVTILGSNDKSEYEEVGTISFGLPVGSTKSYTSPAFGNGKSYRYIRFRVNSTSRGNASIPYFHLAEFNLYKAEVQITEGYEKYVSEAAVVDAANKLESTTPNEVVYAISALQNSVTAYNDANREVALVYNLYYGERLVETQKVVGLRGDAFPKAVLNSNWTYVKATTPEGVVETAGSHDITLTVEGCPFAFADSYTNVKWQFLKFDSGNGFYLHHVADQNYLALDVKNFNPDDDNYYWGFVGNPFDGYRIVNKGAGDGYILSSSTTMAGTTGSDTWPIMTEEASLPEDNNTLWIPTKGAVDNGFYLAQKDYSWNRMNNRGNKLAYWTGGAGTGSTFIAEDPDVAIAALVEDFKKNATHALGYVGGYSEDKADAIDAISSYSGMKEFIAANTPIALDVNKYYRIQNVFRNHVISVNPNNERVPAELSKADVNQIWKFENANTEGTYLIKGVNAEAYMQAAGASNTLNATGAEFEVYNLGDGLGQFNLKQKGSNDLMCEYGGGSIGSWTDGGVGSDMAWYLKEANDIEIKLSDINGEGWATTYLPFDVTLPEGLTAYYVNEVHDGWVNFAEAADVPAKNGVVLYTNEPKTYTLTIADATTEITGNYLRGTTVKTNIAEEAYVLSAPNNEVGFYKAKYNVSTDTTNDGTAEEPAVTYEAWLNNANKAYLPAVAGSANVASYSFRFGEGTTGIDQITDNRVQSTAIYDLTGRRVEAITAPGIYVVNGRKVLVK